MFESRQRVSSRIDFSVFFYWQGTTSREIQRHHPLGGKIPSRTCLSLSLYTCVRCMSIQNLFEPCVSSSFLLGWTRPLPVFQECCGLLAYEEPEKSSLHPLFDLNRRAVTATAINRCVLRKKEEATQEQKDSKRDSPVTYRILSLPPSSAKED